MTTPIQAVETVYQRWTDNWNTGDATFTFENEDFSVPDNASWARVSVRHLDRNQDTLGQSGNRKFRAQAMVVIQIYTRPNVGVKTAQTLAKTAADIFEGVSFSGLDFLAGSTRESGPDGKWQQTIVEVPFDYDETK